MLVFNFWNLKNEKSFMDARVIHLHIKLWDYYDTKVVKWYEFSSNDIEHINKGETHFRSMILI
jgi:hypothetical protein